MILNTTLYLYFASFYFHKDVREQIFNLYDRKIPRTKNNFNVTEKTLIVKNCSATQDSFVLSTLILNISFLFSLTQFFINKKDRLFGKKKYFHYSEKTIIFIIFIVILFIMKKIFSFLLQKTIDNIYL